MVAKTLLTVAARKKIIVFGTAIVIAVLCFVPPWQYDTGRLVTEVGYGLIISPPSLPEKTDSTINLFDIFSTHSALPERANRIDVLRLAVECFAAAVVGGALFYGVKE
jgi:hypothetical protein